MRSRISTVILLIFFWLPLQAQPGKFFSADMEISNSLINQVYQDRKGIIWIATEDGLNKYDGSKFTVYRHDENDPSSPLNNYVKTFFEDDRGNFYIGYFNGLQVYDYATDRFTEVPLYQLSGYPFSAHVVDIIQRRSGEVLVATSGLWMYQMRFDEESLCARQLSIIDTGLAIITLHEDDEQNLWFSTEDKGLYRIDREHRVSIFFDEQRFPKDVISSLCRDREGNLYAGSLSTGLYRHDKATDTFVRIPYPENRNLPIKALCLNREGDILIGTDGYGMKLYRPGEVRIRDDNFNVTTFDFSKSKVHSILEDRAGNIWLGIFQKGVMLLPARSGNFGYIGYKSIVDNLTGSNCIMSLYQDRRGTVWVGTDSDGLYGIDPVERTSRHFPHSDRPGGVPSTIMSIFEDSDGNLWLGSYLHGLAKMDRRTGNCQFVRGILFENRFPVQRIYSLAEDEQKNLWIGTMGGGLFYMNLRDGQVRRYDHRQFGGLDNEINHWINCLLKTSGNKLFVGTHDGLAFIDLATKKQESSRGSRLLARQVVYSLYEDESGTVWAGTANGLTSYDPESEIIVTYTMNDGLPSNTVCAVTGDGHGNLWISTNYGISCFDPSRRSFRNYFAADGLQGNEFSKNSVCVDDRGNILFGGLNGITYFHPDEVTDPVKELDIRLTDFYIHDRAVRKGMRSGNREIIDTAVTDASSFHLSYDDNSFTIEYSAMEFNNPDRISYLYSMNGDQWIRLGPGMNRVSFNNLAPGKYRFRVVAEDFNVQSQARQIDVIIYPPWYLTIWAKGLYTLVFITLAALVILHIRQRQKTRHRMLEHRHAEEINEAKLQFFINVSHEIRTPMTLVMNPLQKLMATDDDPSRQKAYRTMSRNVDRVLDLVNQLMDVRKIEKGQMKLRFREVDMVDLLGGIHLLFTEQAAAKKIDFSFLHPEDPVKAWVDPGTFDKALVNILSNAFKFTPEGGTVSMKLEPVAGTASQGGWIEITVSDDGIGIAEAETERIFERFYQAPDTPTKLFGGTGIGLHFARSIVELHHGTIRAQNNPDSPGSRFIIRIPSGCSHLTSQETDPATGAVKPERAAPAPAPGPEEPKVKSKSKRHVLVVDDDPDIREFICRELSPDYRMTECGNGRQALEMILRKAPDLVISDVVMPEMDGITLCRKIRQNININHVPVILLTARSGEQETLEGLETGADAYIVKPFRIEVLRKTAHTIIRNRELLRNTYSGNQYQKDKLRTINIKSADDRLMERIMKVINHNLSNPGLNVEMIAAEVGISRVHLHRKLKELTNQSTRDLIRNHRLQQAAALLASKRLTVGEVAAATGFTNQTHFSSAFKEAFGMSPMAYMEEHLKKETGEDPASGE